MKYLQKNLLTMVALLCVGWLPLPAQAKCVDLARTLSYGMTSKTTGGEVAALQNFLIGAGYLAQSPVGRYGEQTVVAVKKFQKTKKIQVTGSVGALTRAAIKKESCITDLSVLQSQLAKLTAASVAQSVSAPVAKTVPTAAAATTPVQVSSPSAGDVLTIGQKYTIRWANQGNLYNEVLLEDKNGVSMGYISGLLSNTTNEYLWKVGDVSIASSRVAGVPPGEYRIVLRGKNIFSSNQNTVNQYSGRFTINEIPLSINRMEPTTTKADDQTDIVLTGSGFNSLTKVYLNGGYYDAASMPIRYVSSDGKVIIFSVHSGVREGEYKVYVLNDYSSFDNGTSTPSNSFTLSVTQ